MSTFTQRLNSIGEFSVGAARFAVIAIKGAWFQVAQTHAFGTGARLPEFDFSFDGEGRLDISTAITVFPTGFIVPQTHAAFDSVKAQIADFDSQQLELCPVCVGNSVTLDDMTGACSSCIANLATIDYLKTV